MLKSRYLCGGSLLAVALTFGAGGAADAQAGKPALAAAAATAAAAPEVSEVVVTGSNIAGASESSAVPVDVIGAADLKSQGNPTIVQLVKTIPASQSAIGESNRYNGGAGTASINLRGFGASRTLTLMNGRRLADSPAAAFQGGGADLNFIPQAAIGRIEILKDGAAAIYGSDAIGGVVNFITRKNLEGFDAEAEYTNVRGSDGDYLGNLAWGRKFDAGNVLLAASYRHRSRLDIHERDWALRDFASGGGYNGADGFTGAANPGFYQANVAAGRGAGANAAFRDNGCAELGGVLTNTVSLANPLNGTLGQTATASVAVPVNAASPLSASSVCRFQFSNFNDLVNEEDHYQLYAEVNFDFSDKLRFHGEAAWNRNNVPDQRLSPANLSTQFPTPTSLGGLSGSLATPGAQDFFVPYNVPANNPGLIDLLNTCAAPLTAAQCASGRGPGGLDISQTTWRAIAFAGHPLNPDKADHQDIEQTEWRVSAGLAGELPWGIHFDSAVTYMEATQLTNTSDLLVDRIQLGLNGFASTDTNPNSCAPALRTAANAGNAAVGCYFFNPFTNGLATSAVNGAANPFYRGAANPALINNPHAVDWMYGNYTNQTTNSLLVGDLVFTGKAPVTLPGGDVAWAAGAQWRYDRQQLTFGDFNNYKVYPCVDSIDDGTPVCQAPAGPIQFFGSNANSDTDRSVYAVFGELRLPLFQNFEASLAARYEDYKGGIGATTNPKLSLRWQALDWFALRGSISNTFRAPSSGQIINACATGVANIGGQYRAVQTCGNPSLQPEKARAVNVGAIVSFHNFNATLDYYKFNFKNELTTESATRMFATLFPAGTGTGLCGTVPALEARFQFAGGVCNAGNVLRIDTFNVNGPATDTSGLDFKATYAWNDFLLDGTSWSAGVDATKMIDYKRGAFSLLGAPSIVFTAPEDRAGLYDLTAQFFSYPKLRALGFLSIDKGPLNVRWQVRYTEGTSPAFGTTLFREVADSSAASGYRLDALGKSDDFWQHDLIVRYQLGDDTTITGSIQNLLDTDPPFAASNFNYDYTNGNPLGRTFKLNVRKRF
jgi:iron complex outermembrane receptor protein